MHHYSCIGFLAPFIQQLIDQMRATIGGDEAIGMDPMGFLMDTPLMGLLHFLGSSMSTSPEEMVEELLAKVHNNA